MKPAVFIASAGSSLKVAHTLAELLDGRAEPTVWDQGFFEASEYTLVTILEKLPTFDYGIFVFTDDDECKSKGKHFFAPRDNVVFELGIFIGRLGKDSCFIVKPKKEDLKIPSDLAGLTLLEYDPERADDNLVAALGPTVNKLERLFEKKDEVSAQRVLNLESYLLQKHQKEYLSDQFIKDVVCKNQGALAEFNFISSKRHKELKNAINRKKPTIEEVADKIDALENYMHVEFVNACRFNFDYLIDGYFKKRYKRLKPRVCLKTFKDESTVQSWCRDRRSRSQNFSYPFSSNSGFAEVFASGGWYLSNDLPKDVKEGKYINPRLDIDLAKHYSSSAAAQRKFRTEEKEDGDWIKCWRNVTIDGRSIAPNGEECYKSTLIIPLTLINNKGLGPEFKQHFELDDDDPPNRAIYGYLCFDSQYTDFFSEKIDINVGYIFADLLSLYLITFLNYTTFSDSFTKAIDFIDLNGAKT